MINLMNHPLFNQDTIESDFGNGTHSIDIFTIKRSHVDDILKDIKDRLSDLYAQSNHPGFGNKIQSEILDDIETFLLRAEYLEEIKSSLPEYFHISVYYDILSIYDGAISALIMVNSFITFAITQLKFRSDHINSDIDDNVINNNDIELAVDRIFIKGYDYCKRSAKSVIEECTAHVISRCNTYHRSLTK